MCADFNSTCRYIYMNADAINHIDIPLSAVPFDGSIVRKEMPPSALLGLELLSGYEKLQVVGLGEWTESTDIGIGDIIIRVGDKFVSGKWGSKTRTHIFDRAVADALDQEVDTVPVDIERHPYGNRNTIPAGSRGWVYLERFCSMLKVAMLNESALAVWRLGSAAGGQQHRARAGLVLLTSGPPAGRRTSAAPDASRSSAAH